MSDSTSENSFPDDYFTDINDEILSYLEQQAHGAILESKEAISKVRDKGSKLVDILIVGIGAGLVFLLNGSQPDNFRIASCIFVLSWSGITAYIAHNLIKTKTKASAFNSPKALYSQSFKNNQAPNKVKIMRQLELHNMSLTIDELNDLNKEVAEYLNKAITAIALSGPLVIVTLIGSILLT
ncbi:hypothetical protein ADP71_17950 [Vitreoscilla sp. C1]|uniref:hypothetical protein n=1 Tax=Vitreoscilla sp. (strain C1) TaxID=96942 RepID=UPI000CDBAEF2|nr:hypothetical protein [Vitreoscilla sp. C1]AUZ05320.1 hypothetical protein ADP71_17950 [Vitreoscilla sp. C1]